jgi:hypothetical protein
MPDDDPGQLSAGISLFSSQMAPHYIPRERVERTFFLWLGPGLVKWTIDAYKKGARLDLIVRINAYNKERPYE